MPRRFCFAGRKSSDASCARRYGAAFFFAPCRCVLGLFVPGARAPSEAVLRDGRKAERFDRLRAEICLDRVSSLKPNIIPKNPSSFQRSNR